MGHYEVRILPENINGNWAICAQRLQLIGDYAIAHNQPHLIRRIVGKRYLGEQGFEPTADFPAMRRFATEKDAQDEIRKGLLTAHLPAEWG